MIYDLCARIPNIILSNEKVHIAIRDFFRSDIISVIPQGQGYAFSFAVKGITVTLLYIHEDKSPCVFESKILNNNYEYVQQMIFELPKTATESIYNDLARFCKYVCDCYSCPMLLTLDFEYEICYMKTNSPIVWTDDVKAITRF